MLDFESREGSKYQKGTGARLSELEWVADVPPDNLITGFFPNEGGLPLVAPGMMDAALRWWRGGWFTVVVEIEVTVQLIFPTEIAVRGRSRD